MNSLMSNPNEQQGEMPPAESMPQNEGQADPAAQTADTLKQAVGLLYGEHFDRLVELFKTSGEEGFPKAMATAINTVIQSLEQQQPVSPEVASAVGMKLFFMLLEDVVKGNLLPQLPIETIKQALGETLAMYAKTHADTVTEQDMQQLFAEINQREQGAI